MATVGVKGLTWNRLGHISFPAVQTAY